jgi:tetratricopeptide (TPR) repeat protein
MKVLTLILCTFVSISQAAGSDTVRLQTFSSHSRLSLRIDEGVVTKFSSGATGFELLLEGATLLDLGAPLGEEARWKSQFTNMRDPRLGKVDFEESQAGVKITGQWVFPKGDLALENPVMEYFDFRDKASARYVVDFWPRQGPTLAQAVVKRRKVKQDNELKDAEEAARRRAARRIASLKARQEAEDTLRFCRLPLSESNTVFLPAYGEHEKVNFSKWIPNTMPDAGYKYLEPKPSSFRIEQYVRLALHLYSQGKPALAIRTIDFLERDHPDSNYADEMRFLRANALLRLGLQTEAERLLAKLVAESGDSPEAIHAAIYLALRQLERGQSLASLEGFLWLIQHHSDHRWGWVFHLGAAEALTALKQTDRAAKEYEWVAENAPDRKSQAEGALRQGDLFLMRLQYDQALASYFKALSRFPEEARTFPSIALNRAETLYGLAQWDRAEHAFKDFLEQNPSYSHGWLATYRLGEILARSEDPAVREKARSWYAETINRYPFSPAAILARLRLLPCGDHGGLDKSAALKFLDEDSRKFDGGDEFQTTLYGSLRALARVRTLAAFGNEAAAIDAGLDEIAEATIIGEPKNILTHYLRVLFRKAVASLLDQGKKYEALALYDTQGKKIPPPAPGSPPELAQDYLLKLSQAASDLGLAELALKLSDAYRLADAHEHGREVAGDAPLSDQDLEVRIQAAEKSFTEAKARWIAIVQAPKPDSSAYATIRQLLSSVPGEAWFSQQSEIIQGLMDEREGKLPSALAHSVRAQILESGDLRLVAWGASLQGRAGDAKVALEMYRNLENHLGLAEKKKPAPAEPGAHFNAEILGVPPTPSVAETILAQAEAQEKLGRWGDAALTYERAMSSGKGGNHAVYGYARALLNAGPAEDRAKALKLLEKLSAEKEGSDDFWARLARQKLADERKREPSGFGSESRGAGSP